MMYRKTSFLMMALLAGYLARSGPAMADALCPDTGKSSDLSVGNVSDLQFDIDRLSLCVQRARLLQQIDEIVKQREDLRMQPFGVTGNSAAMNNNVMIPPMPMPPDLPSMPKTSAVPAQPIMAAAPVPAMTASDWKIQRIWGQGDTMQAQLAKDDMIANVKLNDILPSGERVSVLSARGVTLDNGKTAHPLNWLENTKKNDANNMMGGN